MDLKEASWQEIAQKVIVAMDDINNPESEQEQCVMAVSRIRELLLESDGNGRLLDSLRAAVAEIQCPDMQRGGCVLAIQEVLRIENIRTMRSTTKKQLCSG